ncbi:hypothetical protein CKO32_11320 [Afifella marina DSM 2698]|uniref:VanZ like family protein n=2 Tax=Afifellaceae TaxID=2829802 RepID=A0A1G5NTD0_AFIMA|nr:hypothetical protein [Afifella marina DSM 2698]MBK1627716.1 hypothetical protein [Afifella marina]MBK5916440.1 hypothetical protein [Afifella marina]RAI20990.1 hypothetical protein CH311_08685 [Afifella marina DSM 2698]SCZ40597.1 VanZ like family protein [Afifella marina DSM 2698]
METRAQNMQDLMRLPVFLLILGADAWALMLAVIPGVNLGHHGDVALHAFGTFVNAAGFAFVFGNPFGAAIATLAFSGWIELLQMCIPWRTASMTDFYANVIGALGGATVAALFQFGKMRVRSL